MTMTYGQLESALEAALGQWLKDGDDDFYVWVQDFTDSWVIYATKGQSYQVDYTVDAGDGITFSGDPVAVFPVTTWAPIDEPESLGRRAALEQRMLPNARTAARLARPPRVEVRSEPLTYQQGGRHSYFRDLLLTDRVSGATDRLRRHVQEMEVVTRERAERAERELRAGGFEYRVEPNTASGTGGNFTVPLWMNELFATAPRPKRVLADLITARFHLPSGVSSVNLPILTTGTEVQQTPSGAGVPNQDITDSAGSSIVVVLAGEAQPSYQLLEQSPSGAALDWALFLDMSEAYDADLETQLVAGLGKSYGQLLGVSQVATGANVIAYTSGTPTGTAMFPYFGKAAAVVGDGRDCPPEVWLMRTARWSWLMVQEDSQSRPLEVPTLAGPTPYCPGSVLGWPAWLSDATPANLGAGSNQDQVIACRPSDLILLEGSPQLLVDRESLSGSLTARIQMHNSVAAITNRYPAGIAVLGGTGFVVQSGF